MDSAAAGNQLTNMLPGHTSSWWPIVEDVFSAPSAVNMEKRLLEESVQNGECTFICIDGTFRACLPVMGQAKFTEPKAVTHTIFLTTKAARGSSQFGVPFEHVCVCACVCVLV